jgi:protein associated with RNAse G/E
MKWTRKKKEYDKKIKTEEYDKKITQMLEQQEKNRVEFYSKCK